MIPESISWGKGKQVGKKGWSPRKHTFPSLMLLGARKTPFVQALVFTGLCVRQPSESYLLGDTATQVSWNWFPGLSLSSPCGLLCTGSRVAIALWKNAEQVGGRCGTPQGPLDPHAQGSVVSQGYTRVWICFSVGWLKNTLFSEDVCMCLLSEWIKTRGRSRKKK